MRENVIKVIHDILTLESNRMDHRLDNAVSHEAFARVHLRLRAELWRMTSVRETVLMAPIRERERRIWNQL